MPKKIETQIDLITRRAVRAATAIFAADTRKWERQISEAGSYSKAKNLKLKVSDLTKRLYEQVFFLYYFMGLDSSLDDVNALKAQDKRDGAKNVPPPKGEITFTVWQSINWETIGFPEALRIFRDKRIIPGPEFKAAEAAIKNTAFSVQRIDELNVIEVMNESIVKAIENGTVFRDWVDKFLPDIFQKAGYKAAPGLTPRHLETIFRTNQASAYNAGRWDGFQADDYVLALKYLTVGDNRVREEHIELNGFVAFKGDAVWREIYPPNGYNCRCSTMPLSRYRMRQDGIELTSGKPDTKNVDPDFRDAAGLFNYRDRLAAVVRKG